MKKKKEKAPQQPISYKATVQSAQTFGYQNYIGIIVILFITFFIYRTSLHNGFVLWDDDKYIQDNPYITSINLKAFFSNFYMGNYHPITMLSYALEYHFFGLNPKGYHIVSLLLHLINIVFVFYSVFLFSNKYLVAIIAALLFGIHPMHVESVAWASELKDLLYCLFFLASYIFYLKYIDAHQKKFYYLSLLLFLVSLLSKGMAVSLPVILLLTDYIKGRAFTRQSILEKIPFFILAIVFGFLAVSAQKSLGATESTVFPFIQRIPFASYAFCSYLIKLLIPINLSAYYPYPVKVGEAIPILYYFYLLAVLGIGITVYYLNQFSKVFLFGILFFASTLFLVLQLLPVGDTIMADRYSYIPSIGIFYLLGEGINWLWNNNQKIYSYIILLFITIFFSAKAISQCKIWKNGLTLWNDVIEQYQIVPAAYYNRGIYYLNNNQNNEALSDFNKAIALKPDYGDAYNNRSSVFIKERKLDEALADLNNAIKHRPELAQAYFNRGFLYSQKNNFEEALKDYTKVIEFHPDNERLASVLNLRAILYMNEKKYEESLTDFNKTIELKPDFVEAISNRGSLLIAQGKYDQAIQDFSKAIEMNPTYLEAYFNRGIAEFNSGNKTAGCNDWQHAANSGYEPASQAYRTNCK